MKRRRNEPHLQRRIGDPPNPNGNTHNHNHHHPNRIRDSVAPLGAADESNANVLHSVLCPIDDTIIRRRSRRIPRKRHRLLICFIGLLWWNSGFLWLRMMSFGGCYAQQQQQSPPRQRRRRLNDDNNNSPEKGNTECASLSDRYERANQGDTQAWLEFCNDEPESGESTPLPAHGIALTFYSSLPAFGSDFNVLLTYTVMTYLSSTSYPESYYSLQYNSAFAEENFSDTSRSKTTSRNKKNEPPPDVAYDVFLQITNAKKIKTFDAYWWWKYEMRFFCFMRDSGPLLNHEILYGIENDLNRNLRNLSTLLASFQLWERSRGVLGFSVEDPRTADDRGTLPFVPGPPTLHPTQSPTAAPNDLENTNGQLPLGRNSNPTFVMPLNAQAWDWRRYLGLSLFLATLGGTFLLMQMSYRRRRKIEKHELWGNYLGTEQGVNALLDATGWKVSGSRLEVYDKGGWGYRDDDSMFMGGYQQTEVVHTSGAGEITVTSPDSLSTPETPTGMNTFMMMEEAPRTPPLLIS